MTKAQLLAKIASKYAKVSAEQEVTDNLLASVGLKRFRVYVWDINNEVISSGELQFYTNDNGSEAYWIGAEPKATHSPSFMDRVYEYLDGISAIDAYIVDGQGLNTVRVKAMVNGVEKVGYVTEVDGVISHIIAS